MSVSRLTALIIQNRDDIECSAGGPVENGKFVGWVTLGPEDRCRPLLNSEPLYDTAEAARKAMEDVVAEIRSREVV